MTELKSHYAGNLKFLISNGVLHISDMAQAAAPSHYLIGFLLGIVSKKDALDIYYRAGREQQSNIALVYQRFGQVLKGGYAVGVGQNLERYNFLAGASTVPTATSEDLEEIQRNSKTIFNVFTFADVIKSKLLE